MIDIAIKIKIISPPGSGPVNMGELLNRMYALACGTCTKVTTKFLLKTITVSPYNEGSVAEIKGHNYCLTYMLGTGSLNGWREVLGDGKFGDPL